MTRFRLTYEYLYEDGEKQGQKLERTYGSELAVIYRLMNDGGEWQYRNILIEPIRESKESK